VIITMDREYDSALCQRNVVQSTSRKTMLTQWNTRRISSLVQKYAGIETVNREGRNEQR